MRVIEDQEVITLKKWPGDLGGKRVVLARSEDGLKALWWRTAFHYGHGQDRKYMPTTLLLSDRSGPAEGQYATNTALHTGGRITSVRLESYATQIDAFFGVKGTTLALDITKTLVVS